jgi:hypothetical protein
MQIFQTLLPEITIGRRLGRVKEPTFETRRWLAVHGPNFE